MYNDLRYAFRQLIRNPGFTVVVVLTLALSIGANTTLFSVVNAILLRPLPYQNPDKLVALFMRFTGIGIPKDQNAVSAPEFMDLRRFANSFSHLAAISATNFNLRVSEIPERMAGAAVSPSLFPLLGVQAQMGRVFLPEEEQLGKDTVAVISHALWQRLFASDRNLIGRSYQVNGRSIQIVGVMPPGFSFPDEAAMWTPLAFTPEQLSPNSRGNHRFAVLARIRDNLSFAQARAELDIVSQKIIEGAADYPYQKFGFRVLMNPMLEEIVGEVRMALILLMGAVTFVLLIACANIANLLLARGSAREREFAIRTAVGASRTRLLRQLLTESVLLSVLGAALGLWLASASLGVLVAVAGRILPRLAEVRLDGGVLTFTCLLAILTSVIFGFLPALQSTRSVTQEALKESGQSTTASASRGRLRGFLIVAEVALSLLLLVGAGLLIKSFQRLLGVDPGFHTERVLTVRVSLPQLRYDQPEKIRTFYYNLRERVLRLPGVEAAGLISALPLTGDGGSGTTTVDSQAVPADNASPEADWRVVTPGLFEALRVQLVRGRYFDERDSESSAPVAIIDETMANTYWPNQNPIGKRLKRGGQQSTNPWMSIVGVVKHVRYRTLEMPSRVELYWPHTQNPARTMSLALRSSQEPRALVDTIQREVMAIDPEQPAYAVRTLEEILATSMARRRLSMLLLAVFSTVALLLAGVGICGVVAHSVSQRNHEIGIRRALGAGTWQVLQLVLGHSLKMVLAGVVIGLAGTVVVTRLLSGLLFGIKPSDLTTVVLAGATLLVVAVVASYLPARRATKVDPMVVLRYE
jgi:predicted permease